MRPRTPTTRPAFSVIELLVVVGIVAIATAILLPAMAACRRAARNLKCATQMRTAVFDFRNFVDDFPLRTSPGDEGAGSPMFRIEDFQESLYRVDEFWDAPQVSLSTYQAEREIMMCPEGPSRLQRRAGVPCSSGAVWPGENVSIGFNMRLHRVGERISGRPVWRSKKVSARILNYPDTPLLLDIDGAAAVAASQLPYYTAPPTGTDDLFESGAYWFPSPRHDDRVNIALVGGSVVSTRQPERAPGVRWTYRPE